MNNGNTLIKWPGGKTREIQYIQDLIPSFDRYIEPFFGGGAMFFHLRPQKAAINDISKDLMAFYSMVKSQDKQFQRYLTAYHTLFQGLLRKCETEFPALLQVYSAASAKGLSVKEIEELLSPITSDILAFLPSEELSLLVWSKTELFHHLLVNAADKVRRTVVNNQKKSFSSEDLKENLITGFASGLYMYFRSVYNDILLGRQPQTDVSYSSANFYFIREYCYGSMFRYNSKGEFNIPYGGMSYNRKDFSSKLDSIFSIETAELFRSTDIFSLDFEDFLLAAVPTENDFMFLDPPYDSDFSDYEGRDFTKEDHRRLAEALKHTPARFILIIKNTDFIYSLYDGSFNILCFNKTYTYNIRSRNDRSAEHLIVTNFPTQGLLPG